MDTDLIKREKIIGARRFENYISTFLLFIGSLGFILAGLSSITVVPFVPVNNINLIPQGLLMLFYGILGFGFSLYITLTIIWDVGSGYNEFDKITNTVRLVRKGFPGKNQDILLSYSLDEIRAIEVEISEGINPKRMIYLSMKDPRRIPLTGVGEPEPLNIIEERAVTLAKFLNIPYTFVK